MIKSNKPKTEEELRFERGEFDNFLTDEEYIEYEKYIRSKHCGFGKDNWGEE